MFALPDPPQPLSLPGARPRDRQATQWHAIPTSGSLTQPRTLPERALGLALSPRCTHRTVVRTELLSLAAGWANHDNERVAARNGSYVHWVFRYGPGVEALPNIPPQAPTARATLTPASNSRARRTVRAMRNLCNPERVSRQLTTPGRGERRAASFARPPVRADDQSGCPISVTQAWRFWLWWVVGLWRSTPQTTHPPTCLGLRGHAEMTTHPPDSGPNRRCCAH